MYRTILISIFFISLLGCAQNPYKQFYKEINVSSKTVTPPDKPKIITSYNINDDAQKYMSKYYIVKGFSAFNGKQYNDSQLIQQATDVGASIVLKANQYTNTESSTHLLYAGEEGGYFTFPKHVRRYDQVTVFLAENVIKTFLYGITPKTMNSASKKMAGRNTGASVFIVYDKSPAFYANVLVGDVIIEVDGNPINEISDLSEPLSKKNSLKGYSDWKIIREGKEKSILIILEDKQ